MSPRFALRRAFAALALCLLPLAATAAVDPDDLLPVDQAFALRAEAPGRDRVALTWAIAEGYYLYRHRTSVEVLAPGPRAGALALPDGERHTDEFFGEVETYRGRLRAQLPLMATEGATEVRLRVKYQGCADLGVCYPPQVRTLTVALPAAGGVARAAPDAGFAALGKGLAGGRVANPLVPGSTGAVDRLPLPPEQAFGFEAIAADGDTLLLRFTPAPGYYLYRDRTHLALKGANADLGAPRWPRGTRHHDEHFGEVVVYFDQVDVPLPLRRRDRGPATATLTATFQGCQDEGICYPPMTRTVQIALPAGGAQPLAGIAASSGGTGGPGDAPVADPRPGPPVPDASDAQAGASATAAVVDADTGNRARDGVAGGAGDAIADDSRLAAALTGPGRWWALLGFFGAGLLLAFTPCVLPMIPILSGLIAGAGTRIGTRRALLLSFVYVLANALVFTVAGVVAAVLGANLQVLFQTPWILVAFALLFVALALSSFGLFELQLPVSVRARLGAVSERQRGGSLAGVAAMGALSALIVGPCVAPPLAAAVLYIGQTQDPVFGGAALFLLGMGMGAPLLAFGVAAGRGMPTSGPWMIAAQRVFGFVFLGLAVWMLSRVLPGPATLALYGLVALAAAASAFAAVRRIEADGPRWVARFAGLLLAAVGAAELFGAMAGGGDPLQPLARLGAGQEARTAEFRTIKSLADLDREVASAHAAGRPLLFDFYADWCVSCKEMEKYTFTDPSVLKALEGFVLVKADVTANDATDQALMSRMGIIGPPATLFFRDGVERRELRLFGYEKAAPFAARVDRAARAP